ncbi:sigma-70 family RNA polymerase sigma factor [Streptosporangium sp. KLBMP 9127]|nr:sigma-70 family RNA polymerase sigma factor [Streptosporangium sp. KLBMP 9127]
MPGWPNAGRADDHRLVEALRRVDGQAPVDLYDAYAERLHDYARTLLPDPAAAAEAVHDALVTAHGCVRRLGDANRLRAWLYALTRFQCAARTRGRGTPPHGSPEPEFDEEPADPELVALVHEVLGELNRTEREVLELSLRHGLTPAEVGAVLGLSSRQATTRLARSRDQLEIAAAAVLLARTGRAHCPDLSAMVDSWEGPLTPMLRRRLSGHIGGCEVCTERRRRQVSAARLLDLTPPMYPPLSLRQRVVDTCVRPEREQTRTLITQRYDHVDKAGFPIVVERRSRRRPRRLLPVVMAAVCVLAATGAVIAVGQGLPAPAGDVRAAPTAGGPPVFTPDPEAGPEEEPDVSPGAEEVLPEETPEPPGTPTPTPTAGPSTSAPPRTTRPTTARPRTSRPATRRPAPASAPRFAVTCPADLGESGAGRIQLSARGKAMAWSATGTGGVALSPRRGRLKAGAGAGIWVTVADPGVPGSGRVSFRSAAGSPICVITWTGQDDAAEPPTDPPTDSPSDPPTDEPTESPSTEAPTGDR